MDRPVRLGMPLLVVAAAVATAAVLLGPGLLYRLRDARIAPRASPPRR